MTDTPHILVIDDSADDRMLYRRALQKSTENAYRISECDNGDAVLERIKTDLPQCILLDYSLPGRNGLEVLKHIRREHPFVPVVMMTGQGNEAVAVAAIHEGAQNYIAKSMITADSLQRLVRTAIEHCTMEKRIHDQRAALEVFTRALAHDLKEPMRTIRSFVDLLLEREQFSDKAKQYFQHIQHASDRMHMLIETVYHYTRLDDPAQAVKESCDPAAAISEVKENIDKLIQESDAVVTCDALPRVHVNHTQLIQVLQNLVCNAIHHRDKLPVIHVTATTQGDYAVFRVQDNGPGIAPDHIEKIFDPFKRLSHRENQGAGLGLAICRKIIESHGGKIWCESEPGKGAAFLFTLPLAASDDIAIRAAGEAASQHTVSNKPIANVLLIDDSRADLEITQFKLLERSRVQCNMAVAQDAEQALSLLQERAAHGEAIDLVLLDINMPEMDGFELLEKMRHDAQLQDTRVIMCSGSIYDKDMARAKALGAIGYLTKPVEFAKLKSVIDGTSHFRLCQEDDGYSLQRAAA